MADITVAIGQGIGAYLHMPLQKKAEFKRVVYAAIPLQKTLAISEKIHQNEKN